MPRVEIKPIQCTLPWNKRALSRSASYTPQDTRRWHQNITSKTIGEIFGSALAGFSLTGLAYNLIYKRGEGSILKRYLIPTLGTILGTLGLATSRPPRDTLGADLLSSGLLSVLGKPNDIPGKIKSLARLFLAEDKIKINERVDSLVSNVKRAILSLIRGDADDQVVPLRREEGPHIPDDVSLDYLLLCANLSDKQQKVERVLGNLCNVRDNPNQELLEDLRVAIAGKLKPLGLELDYGYDKKENMFRVYLQTSVLFSHPSRQGSHYKPFLRFSIQPVPFYLALNHLNKCLDEITVEGQAATQRSTLDLNKRMFSGFSESFANVPVTADGGYIEISRQSGRADRKIITDDIRRLLPEYTIALLLAKSTQRNSSSIMRDKTAVMSSIADTEDISGGGTRQAAKVRLFPDEGSIEEGTDTVVTHGRDGRDTQVETFTSSSDLADIRIDQRAEFETLDDILRGHLPFNFNDRDRSEIILLKYCLVRAWLHAHPPKDTEFEKYADITGDLKRRLASLGLLEKAEGLTLKSTARGTSIPQDLLKLDYFLKALGTPQDSARLRQDSRDKVRYLLNLLHPRQKDILEAELQKKFPIVELI